ncbi:hypothetical protein [Plantibacter sp. YIM 135249]|uniref:hypothetical protein n=1 Tax=Plantibacter sp. YIM 135249 TaxID=3423918 RepID=UPI003D331C45
MSGNHSRKGVAGKLVKFRKQIAPTLPAPCVQLVCQLGGTVYPEQSWDVCHLPGRDAYLDPDAPLTRNDVGPGHSKCNRSDGGKVGAALTNGKRRARKQMRAW